VLSAFASTFVLEKMLMKSIMGYGLAAVVAYALWLLISKIVDEKEDVSENSRKIWRVMQWSSTGFLWFTWLSHDVANIAVFLPRELTVMQLILVIVFFIAGLGYIFYQRGGKIQDIVLAKQSTKYVRSATMIDLVYAFLLLYFKQLNNIPMSTTWVFVGLLCGRELALNTGLTKKGNLKSIFPIVAKDFLKLIVGLLVSVAIVLAIHYGEDATKADEPAPASTEEVAVPVEAEPSAAVQAVPTDSIAE
jgi:phosphate/sulfate permease